MNDRKSTAPKLLRVIHLDDDVFELERIEEELSKAAVPCKFKVESFRDENSFSSRLSSGAAPDIILLDVHLDETSDTRGVQLAKTIRDLVPKSLLIMRSGDLQSVAQSILSGADDFISKSANEGELALRLFATYVSSTRTMSTSDATQGGNEKTAAAGYVGATMQAVAHRIPRLVESAIVAIHVSGESGTGKEVVANILEASLPKGFPFLQLNCGAIAPALMESELFGHVKGSFTGAAVDKVGFLEAATGGWVFLDEVATLSREAQTALLRCIENQEVKRIGDTKVRKVSLRILSATNEALPELVKQGKFRQDLWQRLCEAEILLPPLRDRPGEIKAFAQFFCQTANGGPYQISEAALEMLASIPWRNGNVRELRNCIRAMTENHVNKLLTPLGIPKRILDELELEYPQTEVAAIQAAKGGSAGVDLDKEITVRWDGESLPSFDRLTDLLLLECVNRLTALDSRPSLRQLAMTIGMSRSTLSVRLKAMADSGLIPLVQMERLFGSKN